MDITTRRVKLVYPAELVDEPILYQLIRKFDLVTSIRPAGTSAEGGSLVVDVRGDDEAIKRALDWLKDVGIAVTEAEV